MPGLEHEAAVELQGFAVPDEVRERVVGCTDTDQLEAWADRAVTASSITDIFSD
jgi:hypothetical protein